MAELDFRDHFVEYPGHPKFKVDKIIEDDVLRIIVQKYEMIIFTNKGELLGDPDFGCDLNFFLFETNVSAQFVRGLIERQIEQYIPELGIGSYTLDVNIFQDPEKYQDVMQIDLSFSDVNVSAFIGI